MIAELWTLTAAIGIFAAARNLLDAARAWRDTRHSVNGQRAALLVLWKRTLFMQALLLLAELGLFSVGAMAILAGASRGGPLSPTVLVLFASAWLIAVAIVSGRIFNDRLDRILRGDE